MVSRLSCRLFSSFLCVAAGLLLATMTSSYVIAAERLADVAPLPGVPSLTVALPDGTSAHMYPTVSVDAARKRALGSRTLANVTYHGGRINYAGHAIANINTQYFQIVSGVTSYHSGLGSLGGTFTDTAAYPASGCSDSFTPGNCINDTQIRNEITKVMNIKGWTPGFNKVYLLFTSSGEGSCMTSASTSCAYVQYCAYHSFFGSPTSPVIYGNEPFGNNSVCIGTGPRPNSGTSDSAATAARHEVSEATTDPQLNAWFDGASGEETSDKCNFNYGPRTWDFVGGQFVANYMWGGFFFLLQQEYSNHTSNCVQQGP